MRFDAGARLRLAAGPGGAGDDPDALARAPAARAAQRPALRCAAMDRRAGRARLHPRRRVLARAGAGARRERPGLEVGEAAPDAAAALRGALRRDAGELDVVPNLPRVPLAPARRQPP